MFNFLTYEFLENLPSEYGFPKEIRAYDFIGPEMKQMYLQTYFAFCYNSYYVAEVFNRVLWGCVALIILVAWGVQGFDHIVQQRRLPRPIIAAQTLLAKHLALSAGYGSHSAEPVKYLPSQWATIQIPLRLHAILVFLFVAWSFITMFAFYHTLEANTFYVCFDGYYPWGQLVRGFADRTGIMSFGATPLIILLSGRNSVMGWLTGASYPTLQIYHRWISRVVVFEALAHAICFSMGEAFLSVPGVADYYSTSFDEAYWNWGCAAMAGGALLVVASHRRVRQLFYEAFLIGHIAGAILWIVGCYYHVFLIEADWSYLKYIYAAVGLWAFDRFARGVRIAYLNTSFGRGSVSSDQKRSHLAAEGYIVGSGDYVRLRLTLGRSWPARIGGPGTYVFISCPTLNIWESHPFTIAYPLDMPETADGDKSSVSSSGDGSASEKGAICLWSEHGDNNVTFELVLKAHAGFTRKVAKALAEGNHTVDLEKETHSVRKLKLIVDGPYGSVSDVSKEQTVLLISGGSGVSATISHLAHLGKLSSKGELIAKRIVVVWAVRDQETLNILLPYLQRLQKFFRLSDVHLLINLHVTSNGSDVKPLLDIPSGYAALTSSSMHVAMHSGRPVVPHYLSDLVQYREGKVGVAVCGPVGLVDTTREAVKALLSAKQGVGLKANEIAYHEESFTW